MRLPSSPSLSAPLVLLVWQTAVLAQTQASAPASGQAQAPGQAAEAATTPAGTPATTPGTSPAAAIGSPSTLPESGAPAAPKTRGNGAVFGASNSRNAIRPLAVDATLSIATAYDDDLSEGQSGLVTPVGGEYSDLLPALSLSRRGQHAQVSARASTSLRHYPSLHRVVGSSYSTGSDLWIDVSPRTAFRAGIDGTYVSEFAFDTVSRQSGLGNVALSSAGLDVAAFDRARVSYGATGGLTQKIGRHTSLALTATARDSERPVVRELASEQSLGSHLSRSVGRDTSIGFNYALHRVTQRLGGDTQVAWSNDVELGVEHRWRHALERRTVLDLSVGPALVQARLPAAPLAPVPSAIPPGPAGVGVTVPAQRTVTSELNIVASAALRHDMSRSWNVSTTVRRGAGSIDGLLSDAATFDLRGLLSPRLEVIGSAGLFQTELGGSRSQSRYSTRYASSRIQVALNRALAIYGQYGLYYFDYEFGGSLLAPGVAPQQLRRGARAGLTLWAPLHKGR